MLSRHGMRVSLVKREVMWVGHRRKEVDIHLDGKKLKQRDGFVYLGGAMAIWTPKFAAEVLQQGQTLGGKSKVQWETDEYRVNLKERCSHRELPGIYAWLRNDGTNGETTVESAGLQKQLDKKNRGSEESG